MAINPASGANVVLEGSTTTLVRWVESQGALPAEAGQCLLSRPSYRSAQVLVVEMDHVVHMYASALGSIDSNLAQLVAPALHGELASIWASGWVRTRESVGADLVVGLAARLRELVTDLQSSGRVNLELSTRALHPQHSLVPAQVTSQAIGYLAAAGLGQLVKEQRDSRYTTRLISIQTTLGLRPAELARLLQVTREAVRRWHDGAPVAPERWADIDRLERVVGGLATYYKVEALPAVVRRKVPGLGQKTPLELIQAGREVELMNFLNSIYARGVTL